MPPEIRIAHTSELAPATLERARALLEAVFEGDFADSDWEHGLGGLHVLAWEDGDLVGHASLVQRRLLHRGRALRAGYVEAVGVRADRQRRGHGTAMMAALGGVLRRAYEVGALGATDAAVPMYERSGWKRWEGVTSALTPAGVQRTPEDDGAVFVLLLAVPLDLRGELTCDWRDGDVW